MTYYWLLLIYILLVSLAYQKNKKDTISPIILCIIPFFLFFAFRVGFTPDYYNYENLFEKYHPQRFLDDSKAQELGFQWLCIIMPSYRSILVLFTSLYCLCIYIVACYCIEKKYLWFVWVILFCYPPFILGNMSGMRSGFVTCFFFLALCIKLINKSMIGLFLAVLLMAVVYLIHKSAIVLIPLLFLTSKSFNEKVIYLIYLFAASFVFVSMFFPNFLNNVGLLLTSALFEDWSYEEYFAEELVSAFSLISILRYVILLYLLYTTISQTQREKDPLKNLFLKQTVAFYLLVLAPGTIGLIARFYYYFAFPCVIGSVVTVNNLQKEKRILYISCVMLYAFWQLYYFYRKGSIYHYLDYHNILFQ